MLKLSLFLFMISATHANAAFVQTGCDPQKPTQRKSVTLEASDVLLVVAPGNPTTGYNWVSKEGIRGVYSANGRGGVGGGGLFNFAAPASDLEDGSILTFEYKRAWESENPASTCKIKVLIRQ